MEQDRRVPRSQSPIRRRPAALLLDALGTLLRLEPPGPRLRAALIDLGGPDVGEEAAVSAFRAEISHYVANHVLAADPAALEALRDECAAVLASALGPAAGELAVVREAMVGSLRFTPFEDVPGALARVKKEGVRLVVVSNWDCSLAQVLDDAGLAGFFDAVVTSAEAGAAKPEAAPFLLALEAAGCAAAEALMVGDSLENDVRGAEAVGIDGLLIQRDRGAPVPAGPRVIRDLGELASVI
jgi:putative hydrolase of the HAD superfamily